MKLEAVDSERLARPREGSHAMKGYGELVFVAAQLGTNREGRMVSEDLAEQYAQALDNVVDAVWAAGGSARSIARVLVMVVDRVEYLQRERPLAAAWRKHMGGHRPAVTLVEVQALDREDARVAIEATAIV
jgi:enamine deaminase RidA (YjgF/YER057c/UK114 family)